MRAPVKLSLSPGGRKVKDKEEVSFAERRAFPREKKNHRHEKNKPSIVYYGTSLEILPQLGGG